MTNTLIEEPEFETDPYERNWMRFSLVLLVVFAATVALAGFALGFQVPGEESRVDPSTVDDSGPFANPGLRDLGNGEYEVYMLAKAWVFEPRTITVPAGSTITFYVTSADNGPQLPAVQHASSCRTPTSTCRWYPAMCPS